MINIGTNFLYKGPLFLDDRHGIAKSTDDLLNWSISVPEGFEVYLDLENGPAWYTYNSRNEWSEETGYFERRIDKGWVESQVGGVMASIANINSQITNLWTAIQNIEIQPNLSLQVTSNGGRYASGTSVTPDIRWVLKNYGTDVDIQDVTDVTIDNVSIGKVSQWTGAPISSPHTYVVAVTYSDITVQKTVDYTFENYTWTKYFGTSSLSTITSISQIQNIASRSGWNDNWTRVYEGIANCDGGKYPYYVIPSRYFDSSFKMFVGGFRTTAIHTDTLTIGGESYTAIRTEYIQNGILSIRYE